ncbi:hypothetical protein OROGR_004422 [Orobanche gracilis]
MRGDLLTKTRKLVKGFAKAEPLWLKAVEKAPPATFLRAESKLKQINLPEDTYVNKFFQKHPNSKFRDAIKISGFDPPSARVFAWRVLDLKADGVSEEEVMAIADVIWSIGRKKKAKKNAYTRLKEIARIQGRRPPPNPYPSAVREIQAEERKYVRDRFHNPQALRIVDKLRQDRAREMMDRRGGYFGS